jgi:REP element-mobilizing transposase RayT
MHDRLSSTALFGTVPRMSETLRFYRRNLPHWLVADASYFVTLRLKDTVPRPVLQQCERERETLKRSAISAHAHTELARKHFARIEHILDTAKPSRSYLLNPDIAVMITRSLDWLEQRGWKVYASVLMSNHVHILMRNFDGQTDALPKHLASFKSYTAREANRVLKRKGSFWAREHFDHWIRTSQKFESTVAYILNNPVKAGLVSTWQGWKWKTLHHDVEHIMAQ